MTGSSLRSSSNTCWLTSPTCAVAGALWRLLGQDLSVREVMKTEIQKQISTWRGKSPDSTA